MSTHIPKAVLYYSPESVWSCSARLALAEKGYGEDELDLKIVDLAKGENYGPQFLRLNPKATVPTLVVPLQKTLSEEVESRYKAITESKDIIEFLDKSRSPLSRTHTTSDAPAPSLAPATIAFATASKIIVEEVHSEAADPNSLSYMSARDDASLKDLAAIITPSLQGKHQALSHHLSEAESDNIIVSEKTKVFWRTKKGAVETLLAVFEVASKPSSELDQEAQEKRTEYFNVAKAAWETGLPKVLNKLNDEVIGPFALGEQVSIADLHLVAWLARIAKLTGATASDDGNTVLGKVEEYIGGGYKLPRVVLPVDLMRMDSGNRPVSRSKLAYLWDTMKERQSWKKVYAEGLV